MQAGDEALVINNTSNLDRAFRDWLPLHVYWFLLTDGVLATKKSIEESNGAFAVQHAKMSEGDGNTLEEYLESSRKKHFDYEFLDWRPRMKPSAQPQDQPYLQLTIHRVFYR